MVLIKQMLRYSVRTGHPRFMDKLYVGAEPIGTLVSAAPPTSLTPCAGMVSELLTAVLNTNMHVYQVAPVFTLYYTDLSVSYDLLTAHAASRSRRSAASASSLATPTPTALRAPAAPLQIFLRWSPLATANSPTSKRSAPDFFHLT